MLKTPVTVQKQYGIEAERGRGRAIPRGLFAYKGKPRGAGNDGAIRANPNKFDFLVSASSLIMANALPEHGQKRRTTKPVGQQTLASNSGLRRRETVTRRLSEFAPIVESSCRKGVPAVPRVLINRERGFCAPNRYDYTSLPQSAIEYRIRDKQNGQVHGHWIKKSKALDRARELDRQKNSRDRFEVIECTPEDNESFRWPSLKQLLETPAVAEWWDPDFRWAASSFKDVPLWLWDSRLRDPDNPEQPLGDVPRLVATYYIMLGLLDTGEVHPSQPEVAEACGISLKSVYLANKKLAAIAGGTVFRVVAQGGKKRPDGTWEPAKPTMILYLPLRQITPEEAEAERQRYSYALASLQQHKWDTEAYKVFERTLSAWEGTERQWRTFYRQLREDLEKAGIPGWAIARLVPQQPPG